MDDTDKKIEKLRRALLSYKVHEDGMLYVPVGEIDDAIELIDQLKKCREELEPWLKSHSRAQMLIDLSDKWKKEIEQRTKDACFEAGWKWIYSRNKYYQSYKKKMVNEIKDEFKQAIYSAEVKS